MQEVFKERKAILSMRGEHVNWRGVELSVEWVFGEEFYLGKGNVAESICEELDIAYKDLPGYDKVKADAAAEKILSKWSSSNWDNPYTDLRKGDVLIEVDDRVRNVWVKF